MLSEDAWGCSGKPSALRAIEMTWSEATGCTSAKSSISWCGRVSIWGGGSQLIHDTSLSGAASRCAGQATSAWLRNSFHKVCSPMGRSKSIQCPYECSALPKWLRSSASLLWTTQYLQFRAFKVVGPGFHSHKVSLVQWKSSRLSLRSRYSLLTLRAIHTPEQVAHTEAAEGTSWEAADSDLYGCLSNCLRPKVSVLPIATKQVDQQCHTCSPRWVRHPPMRGSNVAFVKHVH